MTNPIRISLAACAAALCFGFQSFTSSKTILNDVISDTSSTHSKTPETKATNAAGYTLVIKKSSYEMTLYDSEGWYGTYPVVFGNKKQDDKKMEGDRLTPEGHFKIIGKKIHKQWGKFLMLDYPTKESYERFNTRKATGEIPKKATIGGGIGIHGTRPNEEWVIDKFINWTSGCISVRYSDMDELYDMLPIGTEVVIEK
ncbi:MAG: L,D-transpeptidase [Chitinophagaceae bacterium]|nr:L,D-transpeptidase [Chitinophagaceae bacterium]